MKKKYDFGLIFSLGLIIAVGSYWFVKEVPVSGVDYYIDLLGERLMSLVPKENDKKELAGIYEEFKSQVKENRINPNEVESIASAIINLSNTNDTLSLDEAEAVLELSSLLKKERVIKKDESDLWKKEWQELNKRLEGVHSLEEKFTQQGQTLAKNSYRVDKNLNVIIDSRARKFLEKEEIVRNLEKKKQIVFLHDFNNKLQTDLEKVEKKLSELSMKDLCYSQEQLRIEVLNRVARGPRIIGNDSLDIVLLHNLDSMVVDWADSLHYRVNISVK